MKKMKFGLPIMAFIIATVGAFTSQANVLRTQTKSYKDAFGNCIAFTDCSAAFGKSCIGLAIYNNITCSGTPVAGSSGYVQP